MEVTVEIFLLKQLIFVTDGVVKPLQDQSFLPKKCRLRGMVSLKGDKLVLFNYLKVSEIWTDNKIGILCWGGVIREGTSVLTIILFFLKL